MTFSTFDRKAVFFLASLFAATVSTSCTMQAQAPTPQSQQSVPSSKSEIIRNNTFVNSDPGIQLAVREVQPRNRTSQQVPILLIHGGGPGSFTSFDLPVRNYSVAEGLAAQGHSVYLMNVRGWEGSTLPPSLNQPPQQNPPAVTSEEAVRDIDAVVNWIRQRTPNQKVALVGWATGGHWAGMYTSRNTAKVSHLVMLNSLYGVNAPWALGKTFENPERPGEFNSDAGAYRLNSADGLLRQWNQTIPVEDKSQWRDPAVAQAYQQQALQSDPTSSTRQPPSLRIPGAYRLESYNLAKGRKYWDAREIKVPALVIRGERDFWSRPADVSALKSELVNAPRVETVTISDGTHYLFLDRPERGRDRFIQEVTSFLQ
ncbi:alpha/beta hydrolase [Leptolyngbya sp. AN03gr2]|uniref:alpha/beta hydrolase n=1 Tax=unclassified Leptolyngbya TaxID=2650499 RepID=UPI003D319351